MNNVTTWLLEGPPWVQYRTRVDLLDQPEEDRDVAKARSAMLSEAPVKSLLTELMDWPGEVLASHKSAGLLMHKLGFVSYLGIKVGDPGIKTITKQILKHQSVEGPFQMPINISESFGGNGMKMWGWALCDAPVTLYGLLKLGLSDERSVRRSAEFLMNLVRDNGWPCGVSPELGKWRGPGRKADPCPYANMIMLKALAQTEWKDSPATRSGTEVALKLWENSQHEHPYMFYMGTDFRKLKAPFIWYDLLHLLEVLTQFPWLKRDARLAEMIKLLREKADQQGRFTAESIWKAWSAWDFGQKKIPSRGLSLLAYTVLKRYENHSG